VRERVLRRLTGSVRELADQVLDLGVKRVPWRIWGELLRLARLAGVDANAALIDPLSAHQEIASHIRTSREQVAREFSRLYREGLLAREGRSLVVRDVVALEQRIADSRTEQEQLSQACVDETRETPTVVLARQRRAVLVAEAVGAGGMMEHDEERTIGRSRFRPLTP
jgi:Crp-like helix-turn-helix protein